MIKDDKLILYNELEEQDNRLTRDQTHEIKQIKK